MEVRTVHWGDVKPYERNPRKNQDAVAVVAESIRQCGYRAKIVVDENLVIIAGETRWLALKELGIETFEVQVESDMTEEQKKKYRLLDNKVAEVADWDFDLLTQELDGLDFEGFDFGFGDTDIDWDDVPQLDKSTYKEPDKVMLRCPKCGHVDSKERFIKQ